MRSRTRWLEHLEEELTHAHRRRPTRRELAEAAGMTTGELSTHLSRRAQGWVDTLDRPVGHEAERTLADLVADAGGRATGDGLEEQELQAYLRAAVANLPERHRLVIVGYFIEGRPMEELAGLLGVTQSRISQIKDFALELLREGIEAQYREGEAPPATGRAQRDRAAYAARVAAHAARAWPPARPPHRPDPAPVVA